MSSGPGQAGRVARAATRYRPGKAPVAAVEYSSSDESDEDRNRHRQERKAKKNEVKDEPITDLSSGTAALRNAQRRSAGIIIQSSGSSSQVGKKPIVKLDDVKIGASKVEEVDSDEYETDTDESEAAGPSVVSKPVFRRPGAAAAAASAVSTFAKKEDASEYETDSDDDEDDDDDDEEDESEEESRPVMLKPIFVSKKQRETLRPENGDNQRIDSPKEKSNGAADDEDAATSIAELQMQERRKQSHFLAAETIKRELAEKKHEEDQPDLSDTDGRDPEEEFSAWRIRELSRIKAERESIVEKEKERVEIERRRALPEWQRLKEDTERAQASRDAKKKERELEEKEGGGGNSNFMQKYYHKGSFFQDMDILSKRNYATAKTENAIDISLLPKVMQVRDYGKAGRSKYTHLADQDTTRQQQDHRLKGISGAGNHQDQDRGNILKCFTCGGPHLRRDCTNFASGHEGRGANSLPVQGRGYSRQQRRSRSPELHRTKQP